MNLHSMQRHSDTRTDASIQHAFSPMTRSRREVEHDARSVVVFADHFAIPYNHLVRKLSDEKARHSYL